jgi:chromate transporter
LERSSASTDAAFPTGTAREVLGAAVRLGLASFGGPVAHLGYFRREYVERRRWLDQAEFADLVALCQLLPGPSSSELGIAIGTLRAGYLGGLAAWLGFTLPSAFALTAFALLSTNVDLATAGWVEGLKLAAVAIVAQAVFVMARTIIVDIRGLTLAVAAVVVMLLAPTSLLQVVVILGAGAIGWRLFATHAAGREAIPRFHSRQAVGRLCLVVFVGLLIGLPIGRTIVADQALAVFDALYRSGSLVFGGGHVVLPLLHAATVTPGWIADDRFLAGYGAAQAVPGPLFTFAAFLGASFEQAPNGAAGAMLALVAIFLPAFLLVWGVLPFWDRLRQSGAFAAALRAANAAVVGILLAALISPIGTSALHSPIEAAIALLGLLALVFGRVPPILVVGVAALAGQLLNLT